MVNVSKEELLSLKIELTESQKNDRHELKNLIQNHTLDLDDYKSEQKVLINTQNSMKDDIKAIKSDMKDGFNKIEGLFKELPNTFATKAEHQANQNSIKWIIKILWTIGIAIILGLGGFVWSLFTNLITNV